MNKKILSYLGMIVFSFLCLEVFKFSPYIVIIILIVFFAYDYHRIEFKLERQNEKESNELKNEIKTTTSDAYLKHKRLLTLVRTIPYPLALLDDDGKVVIYNTHFNMFRSSDEEKEITYLKNDCIDEVSEMIKDTYIFEKKLYRTFEHQGHSYEVISEPVTTKGRYSGSLILFQDVSEAKERESMQKQFIADASHELKTPISVIKGMIEILNRDDFDDEEIRKDFLQQIEKETRRMEIIVRDLLQLSKLSKQTLIIKKETLDFTEILDGCINSFNKIATDKGLEIIKNYQCDKKINVDRELSMTLINNLISNAIKYSDKGKIVVSTYDENERYLISIKDEGVGLSAEEKEKIFERFYRVDKARSRARGGSGLGLSIVKSIVEAQDGIIEVISEEGKGSEFKVYFKY